MSSRNSPTLTLEVNGRRAEALAAWLVLATAGCTIVLLGAAPSWTQWLAVGAVGAIAIGLWRAGWIGSKHRIIGVRWLADGCWSLADSHGKAIRAELSGDTRLAGSAVWLRWKTTPGRRRSMLLVRGDMPAGQLRTLRVRLQIQALERALPDVPAR
jgi:Membrane-bound toxin component of toxin-antitoxin system